MWYQCLICDIGSIAEQLYTVFICLVFIHTLICVDHAVLDLTWSFLSVWMVLQGVFMSLSHFRCMFTNSCYVFVALQGMCHSCYVTCYVIVR